ncbi:hypothetical protein RCH09_000794 [Actimicrobium sp. GrIS 1.19]|uniref:toxin co-regulated pilus biosynthesis Q family protein n=1 Tax=Actimicrobium sp. GrIS 1.19 TaxID=3071708 RepID=UPI002DFF99B9|nr:hypothetical protein [Actimicrobium sp. GrIS 1.19]
MSFRSPQRCTNMLFLIALGAILSLLPRPAAAGAEINWLQPRFTYHAKNYRLQTVFKHLAQDEHLQLHVAPGIEARVTARFDMHPQQLLDQLAAQFHLSWRVEGKHLFIAPLAPLADGGLALRVSPAQSFASLAEPAAQQASVPVTPPANPFRTWATAATDRTVQNTLARWAMAAGWQMVWELPQDFSVEAAASVDGSFEDAVTAVMQSLQSGETPVTAIFYDGNRVLRIVAKGAP